MEAPLFSIVVPIYNVKPYLSKCVDSILAQTYKNFEVILVDDGSPDECPEICDSYARRDSRVVVIHKANGGLVSARQAGANVAKGDYVICVDGDDWIKDTYLELFATAIKAYNPDVLCCGYYIADEQEAREMPFPGRVGFFSRKEIEEQIFPGLIQTEQASYFRPSVWAKAYKRDLYCKHQNAVNPAIKIGEDGACVIPCVAEAQSLFILPDCLYYYRVNLSSMTKNKKAFAWNGPKMISQHLQMQLDMNQGDFRAQLYRKTVHELFTVVVSQFYLPKPYREIVREINEQLDDEYHNEAIKNSRFSGSVKAKLMDFTLKNRFYFPVWLFSKLK